ncbi:hypothetical protein [Nonomuraea rubra]|uniref:hypothetical protein n=1 Tax=Nonomuraea rubra TaxID=46180 RepID=UPI0033D7FF7E
MKGTRHYRHAPPSARPRRRAAAREVSPERDFFAIGGTRGIQPAGATDCVRSGRGRETIGELTERLGVDDPSQLADHLTLVFEGLHASSRSLGPQGPAEQARSLVEKIITAAAPRPGTA